METKQHAISPVLLAVLLGILLILHALVMDRVIDHKTNQTIEALK